jgi:hypothetical protein
LGVEGFGELVGGLGGVVDGGAEGYEVVLLDGFLAGVEAVLDQFAVVFLVLLGLGDGGLDFVGKMKADSSKWIKTKGDEFQDELRQLLQKHGFPYDERYRWD